jgi:hypothetical protein
MKSLKIILPTGLCIVFITTIVTNSIRKDAEKYLKGEEMVVAAGNRQRLAQQEAIRNFEQERQQAQQDREFKRSLGINPFQELK